MGCSGLVPCHKRKLRGALAQSPCSFSAATPFASSLPPCSRPCLGTALLCPGSPWVAGGLHPPSAISYLFDSLQCCFPSVFFPRVCCWLVGTAHSARGVRDTPRPLLIFPPGGFAAAPDAKQLPEEKMVGVYKQSHSKSRQRRGREQVLLHLPYRVVGIYSNSPPPDAAASCPAPVSPGPRPCSTCRQPLASPNPQWGSTADQSLARCAGASMLSNASISLHSLTVCGLPALNCSMHYPYPAAARRIKVGL